MCLNCNFKMCWCITEFIFLSHNTKHKRQISMLSPGFEPTVQASKLPQAHVLGRGYTATKKIIQPTNICLGIHRQTCVATFNPTCLSRLLATEGLLVLSLHIVSDMNGYDVRVYVSDDTGKSFCLKYANGRRRWMYQLWESRTDGECFKLCKMSREFPDMFREYYRLNIKTFGYVMDSVRILQTEHKDFWLCYG